MKAFQSANLDDIIADAKKNDRVDYLKQLAATPVKGGKNISFIELKRAYYGKFYKEMIPVAKPKAKSMWDKISEL